MRAYRYDISKEKEGISCTPFSEIKWGKYSKYETVYITSDISDEILCYLESDERKIPTRILNFVKRWREKLKDFDCPYCDIKHVKIHALDENSHYEISSYYLCSHPMAMDKYVDVMMKELVEECGFLACIYFYNID